MTDALVPARIINEHVYCPRLAWLEWEARAFTENADTAEGSDAHRRVDETGGTDDDADVLTGLAMSSERLGITAKLDRVELRDGLAVPVETKHGKPRAGDQPLWPPEVAQLTAQALLLREAGYEVSHADAFFVDSHVRRTVEIPLDGEAWITELASEIRAHAASSTPPPPLVDSPKCPRCSLVGVCLPDETQALHTGTLPSRRLIASDDPRRPLYVIGPSSIVRKRRGRLVLEVDGEEQASRRLLDIAHVAVFGNATLTAGALRECLQQDVTVLWFSSGGWFSGYSIAHGGSWVARRIAQVRAADEPSLALSYARRFIEGKLRNQRTLLRRLGGEAGADSLAALMALVRQAAEASTLESLLGIEGTAARLYFSRFSAMLHQDLAGGFDLEGRNRRPPKDPVNALLSFVYALLTKDATIAALAAGLDPQIGLMHQPRFGRPSLALDLAEEQRPLVADSTVVTLINNGEIRQSHFVRRGGAVALTASGRKRVIKAYERRMAVTLRHPLFGYEVSYRRALELQARQLAAALEGQFDEYKPLVTR